MSTEAVMYPALRLSELQTNPCLKQLELCPVHARCCSKEAEQTLINAGVWASPRPEYVECVCVWTCTQKSGVVEILCQKVSRLSEEHKERNQEGKWDPAALKNNHVKPLSHTSSVGPTQPQRSYLWGLLKGTFGVHKTFKGEGAGGGNQWVPDSWSGRQQVMTRGEMLVVWNEVPRYSEAGLLPLRQVPGSPGPTVVRTWVDELRHEVRKKLLNDFSTTNKDPSPAPELQMRGSEGSWPWRPTGSQTLMVSMFKPPVLSRIQSSSSGVPLFESLPT